MSHKPQWVTPVKSSGLYLFLVGLLIFLGSLFMSSHTLTFSNVRSVINNDKLFSKIEKNIMSIEGEGFSKYEVVSKFRNLFDNYNKEIVEKYSISEEDAENILSLTKQRGKFSFSVVDTIFNAKNDVSKFKNETLKIYSSWIADQINLSIEETEKYLKEKFAGINNDVVNSKGIDSYRVESFLTPLIKMSIVGVVKENSGLFLLFTFGFMLFGGLAFILPDLYTTIPGIKNNNVFTNSSTNGGIVGMLATILFVGFYIYLYFYEYYVVEWSLIVEPIKQILGGADASRWFVYGLLYTLSMIVMGVRMMIKYRHNNYQLVRTLSIIFFQVCLAFILPEILSTLNLPSTDLKNIWPLDYDFFDAWNLKMLTTTGGLGIFMLVWGITLFVIGVPLFTYLFGKRWYCSWVCGCGGLAETVGDPYRQLSDKSLNAWKIERISIHSVLVFSLIMTIGVLYTYFTESYTLFGIDTSYVRSSYGFLIGSIFSGVVGTGFYPKMGSRVWCRFGCPLAAYLGIIQRFKSRFRITTNGGQCISCGNCSTYCEMGIDVRSYAQRGEDIIRASCVGCGVCSAVCPRGVLKLENGTVELDYDELNKG